MQAICNICIAGTKGGMQIKDAISSFVFGNTIYGANSTGYGLNVDTTHVAQIANNIVEGFKVGINLTSSVRAPLYHSNAAYNNTTNFSNAAGWIGSTANNDALAASPFVDASSSDFDINGTQVGVTEDAWSSTFHSLAATTPKADKGAVQAGAGIGGRSSSQTMKITPGSTDVTTYFKLVDPASGVPKTGLTITDLDATYVRDRAAAVKADLTALAAVDSAHGDNKAIQVDSTNAPGLYRVDWPDAAFASGVDRVQLVVNGAAIDPAVIEVELETPQTGDAYARLGAPAGASVSADIAAIEAQTDAIDATVNSDTFGNSALATLIGDVPTNAELGTALAAAVDAVLAAIAGLGGSGSGSITFTYTLTSTEDGTAIPDAEVWVTARSTTTPVLASGRTNASGQVVFYLEAGLIDVWRRKSGWNFTNPDQEEVA